ncbi:zinc finger BED domain-containing protein RICESLEEPER 2-like [Eutrema salsugineum]|uniref:zinc finger BED domain-containing protein RICESLEEPER 2-like n=1 Tax=Eutrema salsugineum TaxID=72664 RepID=UPI000CED0727|nr:zinc finger BED domain-containing protein RICESLEEPER 2-like [Eutrema salsugineum]
MESEKHRSDDGDIPTDPSGGSEGSSLPQSTTDDSAGQGKWKKTSPAWENFTVITKVVDGVSELRAKCIHCTKDYAYEPHKQGTSNYNRHSLVCNKMPRNGDVGSMLVTGHGKLQARKVDQSVFRDMVAKCIIEHDLPFSYVEYGRVRSIWSYLNADVKFITRKTAAADVFRFYELEKSKLKIELSEIPGRISFTSDLWTAITVEGYICLTAHYVDRHWKLRSKILSFCAMPPPHTGIDLAMKIVGLKVMGEALGKVRNSIKYVQASEARRKLFKNCVDSVGIDQKAGLTLDVPIRWNSTFQMLDRALKYRSTFDSYQGIDHGYMFQPTGTEWNLATQISELLQPFDEITNLISGSTYPTSNLYFMQVYKIELWLKEHENSEEDVIVEMVKAMKGKFDKYWHEYSEILAMVAVFDPRFKLSPLEFCFSSLDESTCQQKVEHVESKLKQLFEPYSRPAADIAPSAGENVQESVGGAESSQSTPYEAFHNFRKNNVSASGKNALDLYLQEPAVDVMVFPSLDVLSYWKDNAHRFGVLATMASDLLSIPITTVVSESSFSIGSRVLNKYRSSLLPRNVQALICARNWLRGFEPYDNESENAETIDQAESEIPSVESFASAM